MEENKRIKIIQKNPNNLFKQWLREIITEAEKKRKKISKTYKNALNSLEKYPLTLYSGHDCAILEGFGPKICDILEEKLQKHLANSDDVDLKNLCYKDKIALLQERENDEVQELVKNIEAAHLINDSTLIDQSRKAELSVIEENDGDDDDEDIEMVIEQSTEKENKINSQNIDDEEAVESCSGSEDSLDRLIRKYDPKTADKRKKENKRKKPAVVQTNFESPVAGRQFKKFKSFNSVSNVSGPSFASSPISKFLDVETSMSRKSLLDEEDEFDKLIKKYEFKKSDDVLPSPIIPAKKRTVSNPRVKQITIPSAIAQKSNPIQIPSTSKQSQAIEDDKEESLNYISVDDINIVEYEIWLLIDTAESKASANEIQAKLREHNVKNEVRKLHVGDFLWIAKHKNKSNELVLPYIVERKRIDDLSSSIKDGRFHEQKFRLKQCGLENVIYLIENYTKGGKVQCGLPFTTLLQAASNTQIQNKFTVKFTESCEHTGMYLAVMTSFIDNIFKNKKPMKYKMLEFESFNQSSVKQKRLTVRETFIKQLLALKGLSVDIALKITEFYPTPTDLYNKYSTLSKNEGEQLLSKLTIGDLKRKIPITVSKVIYNYYMHK